MAPPSGFAPRSDITKTKTIPEVERSGWRGKKWFQREGSLCRRSLRGRSARDVTSPISADCVSSTGKPRRQRSQNFLRGDELGEREAEAKSVRKFKPDGNR